MKNLGVGPSSHVPKISTDDPVEDEDEIESDSNMTRYRIGVREQVIGHSAAESNTCRSELRCGDFETQNLSQRQCTMVQYGESLNNDVI
jgi:hypothetical protein